MRYGKRMPNPTSPNAAATRSRLRRPTRATWARARHWKSEHGSRHGDRTGHRPPTPAGDVYEQLTDSSLRPYRAMWAYLGSAWFALAAGQGVPAAAERAARLLRAAHRAATGTTWLREVQPLPMVDPASDPIDDAVTAVLATLNGTLKSATKFDSITAKMHADLARPDATEYERALVTLGMLLGAESSKPSGKGRADAVWVWPKLWITVEAKSEQMTAGTLSMEYVRQANTHLDSLRADRNEEPRRVASAS